MNYKKILMCFFIVVSGFVFASVKVVKKVSDLAGLSLLLQRQGYEILSKKKEKFEALKEYPIKGEMVNKNQVVNEKKDSCKITQLEEDSFFIEITEVDSQEVLGDYQSRNFFQEEGFELKEESCKVYKETAYVKTFERALEFVVSFYNR